MSRDTVTYLERTGEKGLGRIQKKVLRVLLNPNRNRRTGIMDELSAREVAEIIYSDQMEPKCQECGRGGEPSMQQLVAVYQALAALERRGLVSRRELEDRLPAPGRVGERWQSVEGSSD